MEIKLTTAELLVVLRTLGIDDYPALDMPNMAQYETSEISGMLLSARNSLIARDWVEVDFQNTLTGLRLDTRLIGLMAVVCLPEASFILNQVEGEKSSAIYWHWQREIACKTWRSSDDVHTFELVEETNPLKLSEDIEAALYKTATESLRLSKRDISIRLSAKVIEQIAVLARGRNELGLTSVLEHEHVTEAKSIARIFAQPQVVGGIIASNNLPENSVRAIYWSIGAYDAWIIDQTGGFPHGALCRFTKNSLSSILTDTIRVAMETSVPVEEAIK